MSLVLIRLRTTVQTKALTFEGDLDFQISLSKRNLSILGEGVKKRKYDLHVNKSEESRVQILISGALDR